MNGSRKEGNGPLGGENPRGLFMWSRKVLDSVLLDVLLDSCKYALKVFPSGSSRSYFDPYAFPPSPLNP